MKKVLILSSSYYPNAFVAAHRAAKIAKYLPEHGWLPLVVCEKATEDNCEMYDENLLTEQVQSTILYQTHKRNRHATRLGDLLDLMTYGFQKPSVLANFFASRVFASKSYRMPAEYFTLALEFLRGYMRENSFDCILATVPAPATLAVAHRISTEFSVPWIADFRDTFDISIQLKSERRRDIMLKQERSLLRSSSAITTVSNALKERLEARNERSVTVIHNGFDPDDYRTEKKPHSTRFVIAYTGSIYFPGQDPQPIFSAINRLLDDRVIEPEQFAIEFYGRSNHVIESVLEKFPGLHAMTRNNGPVSHAEAIAAQQNATVLLHLALMGEKGVLTGKLFEYLAARRPILCYPGDDDCVDETLKETNAGVVCRTEQEAYAQIASWYKEWKQSGTVSYAGMESAINSYSRTDQARAFADIMNRASEEARQQRPIDCATEARRVPLDVRGR